MEQRLEVLNDSGLRGTHGEIIYVCKCFCGNTCNLQGDRIRNKHTKSCGCLKRTQRLNLSHGHKLERYKSPTYCSWICMKDRCYNKNHDRYRWYGAKGVGVCDEWKTNFVQFLNDMGERPEGKTLDRINPRGNYEPSNCRWATSKEQSLNKRKGKRRIK